MTQQFHEGQDVEVAQPDKWTSRQTGSAYLNFSWRKAKIVGVAHGADDPALNPGDYAVQFPDGSHGVFDAARIRAADPIDRLLAGGG